MGGSETKVVSS
jgi:hypothetical protein